MEKGSIKRYYGGYDYYLEKSQAAANVVPKAADKPGAADGPGRAPAPAPAKKSGAAPDPDLNAKDRRRERAKQRAGLAGVKNRLEQRVADAEKKLADLEARQQELVAQMSGDGKVDFEQINRELSGIQTEMDATMKAWEDAAWDLEAFRKNNPQ